MSLYDDILRRRGLTTLRQDDDDENTVRPQRTPPGLPTPGQVSNPYQAALARRGMSSLREPGPTGAERFVSELPEGLRTTAGGALRGLASALEPIQLGQDILFASLAGGIDPNTTITERLRSMEWGQYAPGGESPARPASGEEIFTLLGFDEQTSKWAGIAADLTVDPLVFGSWLRVTGKVAGAADLVKLGDQVDDMVSPIGIGREVTNLARRSPHISNFMDSRTEALMEVFRNPNSTVFGVQRFGERATRAAEWVLPKERVDRLRFGATVAGELAEARRSAQRSGKRLNEESLRMLHRAQHGLTGNEADNVVRTYLKGMEEQRAAFEARLTNLDTTVREVIEKEVYDAIRGAGDEEGIGILAYLGSRRGIADAFEEGSEVFSTPDTRVRNAVEEAYSAIEESVRGYTTDRRIGRSRDRYGPLEEPDALFQQVHDRAQERLRESRERIGALARERAERAGLTDDAIFMEEAKATRAFNGYLADTLQIDAKLGLATSGYDFIANQVRRRVVELTGDFDQADRIWRQVLRTGLKGGEKAMRELREQSTGISVAGLTARPNQFSPEEIVRRREAHYRAVEAELDRIRGGGPEEQARRMNAYAEDVEVLSERADALVRELKANVRSFPGWNGDEAMTVLREAEDAVFRYRNAAADLITAEGSGAQELTRFLTTEAQLSRIVRKQAEMVAQTTKVPRTVRSNRPGGRYSPERAQKKRMAERKAEEIPLIPRTGLQFLEDVRREAQELSEELGAMSSRRREYRTRFEAEAAERAARPLPDRDDPRFADIGRRAANAAVPPKPAPPAVGEIKARGEVLPLAGRNTTAEDILAGRVWNGRFQSLDEAANEPITFAELFDGAADMQGLPIGAYLEGLMNGHLRRSYALFGDTNDFKNYIDSLRVGTIVPSRILDEADLPNLMTGYEEEAALIGRYQNLLTRNGRGQVLKKSSIAAYLLNSGVPPERVNGALKSMAQALGPDNGPLRSFLNQLEVMLPDYRKIVADRDRALSNIGEVTNPRVTDRRFFDPAKEVPQTMLETLGEIAQARASLGDSIEVANRVVGRQEMFQNVYDVARNRGLIKSSPFVDDFGARYVKLSDSETVMGGFGGKWVHPHLYEELRRASSVERSRVPYALTRLRALITGGYLAAPSVIAANFFGGLYQAATVGINPATMVRRMVEVAPEVNAHSLGKRSDLVSEIQRNLDIDITSMRYQHFTEELKTVRLEDFGLGPQGINKAFDQVASAYERFLQRPGIGRFRTRFAGLEGFQFTENWFKVAGYQEMKNRLVAQAKSAGEDLLDGRVSARIEKQAAEFARTIVFDYSELPRSLTILKDTGLVLFPGFSYFLAGRTLNAALNRPGTLAVADRMSEAMANASLDLEDQLVMLMGTPEWMKSEQPVPMPFSARRDAEGHEVVDALPFNQLIPTSTIWDGLTSAGNPWAESVAGGGIYGPFFEILNALVSGEGEAVLTARYGNRVFDADADTAGEKTRDIFRFLYNTMAPANIRKLISVNEQDQLEGLIPSLPEMVRDIAHPILGETMERAYTFEEHRTGRPGRTWREEVMRTVLRSPQVIALDGPLAGINSEVRNGQTSLNNQLTVLRQRANRARHAGDMEAYERWSAEIRRRQEEFNEQWGEFLSFYHRYQQRNVEREIR